MKKRINRRLFFNLTPAFAMVLAACGADIGIEANAQPAPDAVEIILPGDVRLNTPEFEPYEVEYGSAFGRFYNQVRKFKGEGGDKISVLNIIEMPDGVIVDHRTIDAKTLRIESFNSPYFAWGAEFVFIRATETKYDLVRVPISGGEPVYATGGLNHNGYFDSLGFSPTFAALPQLSAGSKFQLPKDQPRKGGTVDSVLSSFEIIGKERLELASGVSCDCTVIQETSQKGAIHKYWVSDKAPFLIQRHRDVGGKRDFVSRVISFKPL